MCFIKEFFRNYFIKEFFRNYFIKESFFKEYFIKESRSLQHPDLRLGK